MNTETIEEFLSRGGKIDTVIKRAHGPKAGEAAAKKVKFKKWGVKGTNRGAKVREKTKGGQSSRGTKFSGKNDIVA